MWCSQIGQFLVYMGLFVFPAFSHLDQILLFSQAVGSFTFLRCMGLIYVIGLLHSEAEIKRK
jgi:hypothetical protein